MRKSTLIWVTAAIAVAICLMMTGCGVSNTEKSVAGGSSSSGSAAESTSTAEPAVTMEDYLQAWKTEDWEKAQEIAVQLPEKAEEACVATMTEPQKKAYREVVEKYPLTTSSEDPFLWGYYLTDANNDGSADLVVDYGTCEADRMCTVYTYLEDELFRYQEFGSSHAVMGAYPDHDGFILMTGHMGTQTIGAVCMADRESLEFPVYEAGDKDYITLPYQLDGHINYESEDPKLDLSPLE